MLNFIFNMYENWVYVCFKSLFIPFERGYDAGFKAPTTNICLNMEKELTFSPRTISKTFKQHFPNPANNLVKKLPDPRGKFGIPSN